MALGQSDFRVLYYREGSFFLNFVNSGLCGFSDKIIKKKFLFQKDFFIQTKIFLLLHLMLL